jgi:16S rRNA (cytidine1402-2'-O)-methyltransferase
MGNSSEICTRIVSLSNYLCLSVSSVVQSKFPARGIVRYNKKHPQNLGMMMTIQKKSVSPGTLYLVATPIGNLGDMSLRALETLRQVDVVASEDTRKTGFLLKHFAIKKPQIAFHEHNETKVGAHLINLLLGGQSVAVVSNAGTPGISDPGYTLVRRAIEAGVPVTMVPGAAALIMALVLSGLPAHAFTFRGFPPRKSGKRQRWLAMDKHSPHTLIFYESPHRLKEFLADALVVYGDRPAALCNELTKLYEGVIRSRVSELITHLETHEPQGEYVVVIAGDLT